MAYEVVRFPYAGAVDADGHILEPADLWEEYLEAQYRDRAIRIKRDEDGFEYLELNGTPSKRTVRGSLGLMGAMGDNTARPSPDRLYMDHIPYGASNAAERLDLLDKENLERALLYPTIGLLWECEVADAEITAAYQRAYNRWIADFCRGSGGRLVPIAQLSLLDPQQAAAELERAVKDGCKGGFVAPFTHSRKPHGHADHDPLWAKAQELDVPIAIHPTFAPREFLPAAFEGFGPEAGWYYNVLCRHGSQQALLSMFALGTLERFPRLKLGVLEVGAGWIGSLLDRMDAVFETAAGRAVPLKHPPSYYFKRQCFISGDPDEKSAAHIMEYVGADKFMWASDYPHPDHTGSWVHDLVALVEPLSTATRARVLGRNTLEIYNLN